MTAINQRRGNREWAGRLVFLLVHLLFVCVSLRLVLTALTGTLNPMLTGAVLLAWFAFSLVRFPWALWAWLALLPLAAGLTFAHPGWGMLHGACLGSLFLAWLLTKPYRVGEPPDTMEMLICGLALVAWTSMVRQLIIYPLPIVMRAFFLDGRIGPPTPLNAIRAVAVLCQGLMVFRMAKRTMRWPGHLPAVKWLFACQAIIVILFSLVQWIFRWPAFVRVAFGIHAPFGDIHSYGSFLLILFFVFLFLALPRRSRLRRLLPGICALILLIFLGLSWSRSTWLVLVLFVAALLAGRLHARRRVVLVLLLVLVLLAVNLFPRYFDWDQYYAKRLVSLLQLGRYTMDIKILGRVVMFQRALAMISRFPLAGVGIGQFYRLSPAYHRDIGAYSPELHALLAEKLRQPSLDVWHENAHNYFLQLAAELGISGILLFCLVLVCLFASLRMPTQGGWLYRGCLWGLAAYLATCFSGHPLLLARQQAQFWFVAALLAAASVKPVACKARGRVAGLLLVACFLLGVILQPDAAPMDEQDYGFYAQETVQGKRCRWTGPSAWLRLPCQSPCFTFSLGAFSQNISPQEGLAVDVHINGTLYDTYRFDAPGWQRVWACVPAPAKSLSVRIVPARTFRPAERKSSKDRRRLGVLMTPIHFLEPPPMLGLSKWLPAGSHGIPNLPGDFLQRYRFMANRAVLPIARKFRGMYLLLYCPHTGLDRQPVVIRVRDSQGGQIDKLVITSNTWHQLYLAKKNMGNTPFLVFSASRTTPLKSRGQAVGAALLWKYDIPFQKNSFPLSPRTPKKP